MSFQWLLNGTAIPGAIGDTLLLTNVTSTNQGQYSVIASNLMGATLSVPASLFIDSDADGLPDSWEISHFGNLNVRAASDSDGDGVSNYQEYLDGTDPNDAGSARFRINLSSVGGTVMFSPLQQSYTNGQSVTLTANGTAFLPFRAWTGDIVSRSNTISLQMTNNKTLIANFYPNTYVWTNVAGGDWNVASNWSPNLAPSTNDSVVIPIAATVTLSSNVDITDLTVGNLTAGPDLTGTGTLTIRGIGNWSAGTMSGAGKTVVAPGASLSIVSYLIGETLSSRTLDNAGTTAFYPGFSPLNVFDGVITNRAGATFSIVSSGSIGFGSGAPRLDNAGTFLTPFSGASSCAIAFNNYGTLNIQGDVFSLRGGGLHGGAVTIPASATLNFASGSFTSSGSPSMAGDGQLVFSGGSATLSGPVHVTGSNIFSSGSATFTGDYSFSNTMIISGGAAVFDGQGVVAPQVLNLSSGTLGGTNLVSVTGSMIWSGGTMQGAGRTLINPGATMTISNSTGLSIDSRTFENAGTTVWQGSSSLNLANAVVSNRNGATFTMASANTFQIGSVASRFDNAGVFQTATVGNSVFSGVAFNNYGDTQVRGGALQIGGGGGGSGTIEVQSGATLNLSGGSFALSPASSVTGAGNMTVSGAAATLSGLFNLTGFHVFNGGSVEINGNYILTNSLLTISGGTVSFDGSGLVSPLVINLTGGTLSGSNTVSAGSTLNWFGGNMDGPGKTLINPGATMSISNVFPVSITSRTLENAGNSIWSGPGNISLASAVITNRPGGIFELQNSASWNFSAFGSHIDNAGILRKSGSVGASTIGSGIPFTNYGTLEIQSGIFAANGGFVSGSNSTLAFVVSGSTPLTNYGRLQAAGTVLPKGNLLVNLTNNYLPSVNDSFTLLTASSLGGTFPGFAFPSDKVLMVQSNTPTSIIVLVTNVFQITRPILLPPVVAGTNITLTWTSVSNLGYRLEYSPRLDFSNWTALPGDVIALGTNVSKIDGLTSSNRFYRVRILQ